jgi:AcrR family transcriptional regulator
MVHYDRVDTTARIFRAASMEFAQHGIAGARVDRIAAAADSSKALIYSYFGDKEALFSAVLRSRLTELAEAVVLTPDRVDEFVGDLFDFMTSHPDVLRLVTQEAMAFSSGGVPDFEERRLHYASKTAAVAQSQLDGAVDPSLDPSFVVLSLMGLVSWFVAAPQITHLVIGDPADEQFRARYRAHLTELSRRLLHPGSAAGM